MKFLELTIHEKVQNVVSKLGVFKFVNVIPGDYYVRVSQPSWTFASNSAEVSVKFAPFSLQEDFIITGNFDY